MSPTDAEILASLSSAVLAAIVSAYFAYRMGQTAAEEERDQEIDRRVRELELGMVEVQVLIRNRRKAKQRQSDADRFGVPPSLRPDDDLDNV